MKDIYELKFKLKHRSLVVTEKKIERSIPAPGDVAEQVDAVITKFGMPMGP